MKKKVIRYSIFLLILPIVISIVMALSQDSKNYKSKPDNTNSLDIKDVSIDSVNNNSYIYLGVLTLVIGSAYIWWYIKNKEDF